MLHHFTHKGAQRAKHQDPEVITAEFDAHRQNIQQHLAEAGDPMMVDLERKEQAPWDAFTANADRLTDPTKHVFEDENNTVEFRPQNIGKVVIHGAVQAGSQHSPENSQIES